MLNKTNNEKESTVNYVDLSKMQVLTGEETALIELLRGTSESFLAFSNAVNTLAKAINLNSQATLELLDTLVKSQLPDKDVKSDGDEYVDEDSNSYLNSFKKEEES